MIHHSSFSVHHFFGGAFVFGLRKPGLPFLGGGAAAGLGGPDAPGLAGAAGFIATDPNRAFNRAAKGMLGDGGRDDLNARRDPQPANNVMTMPSNIHGFGALPAHTDNKNTEALTPPMNSRATPTRLSGLGLGMAVCRDVPAERLYLTSV